MQMNNAYLQWNQNEMNETCMNDMNKRIFTSKKQEKQANIQCKCKKSALYHYVKHI